MALKTIMPFPIFAPTPTTTTTASSTELRFSRCGNADADKFNHRPQQLIQDDLRRLRRFRTPSSPSRPANKSKYSNPDISNHPAFRRHNNTRFPPPDDGDAAYGRRPTSIGETEVKIADGGGLSYVVPGAPFEFMYSYTETPRVRPVGLREPAVAPFGPGTIPRPWTGRKPLPGSKKELPQFDSFVPPPAGKKGVKSVQQPGPYLPGSGPRYTMVREEVLGEALTEEEVKELVEGCRKTNRQLNIGRDGLTHNMLDNIHAHWKRRRVCKIRCKGVCTVDMDNVCQQLEERTGGKIIYRRGGILYLFRGRNYNYKTRPRFPLMLWKPVSPVYPRLVKRIPEGLTLQEATDMRRRGRELPPICKLGKNGVYINLVKTVQEAFEVCDLVRINCQGLNPSDYRKIGAKLKDLVPCVLISFENEHVLMWRGKDWKSSLVVPEDGSTDYKISESDSAAFLGSDTEDAFSSDDEQESTCSEDEQGSAFSENKKGSAFLEDKQESVFLRDKDESASISSYILYGGASSKTPNLNEVLKDDSEVSATGFQKTSFGKKDITLEVNGMNQYQTNALERETPPNSDNPSADEVNSAVYTCESETRPVIDFTEEEAASASMKPDLNVDADGINHLKDTLTYSSGNPADHGELQGMTESTTSAVPPSCTEGVLNLLRQALESGSAVVLDNSSIDADMVYERSVAFAQVAPPGPVFIHRPRKVVFQKCKDQESVVAEVDGPVSNNIEVQEAVPDPLPGKKTNGKTSKGRKSPRTQKPIDFKEDFLNVVPQGSLKVDELAKLLA